MLLLNLPPQTTDSAIGLKDDLLRPPLQAKAGTLVEMPHFVDNQGKWPVEVHTRHGATTWLNPMIMKENKVVGTNYPQIEVQIHYLYLDKVKIEQ